MALVRQTITYGQLAIFSLLPYISPLPGMPFNVLTVICIFLPLSSLWASAAATTRSQPASQPLPSSNSGGVQQRLFGSITSGTTDLLVGLDDDRGPLNSSSTMGVRQSSVPSHSEGVVLVNIIDTEKQNLPVAGKS